MAFSAARQRMFSKITAPHGLIDRLTIQLVPVMHYASAVLRECSSYRFSSDRDLTCSWT